jgi:hypothetical protein
LAASGTSHCELVSGGAGYPVLVECYAETPFATHTSQNGAEDEANSGDDED